MTTKIKIVSEYDNRKFFLCKQTRNSVVIHKSTYHFFTIDKTAKGFRLTADISKVENGEPSVKSKFHISNINQKTMKSLRDWLLEQLPLSNQELDNLRAKNGRL